MFLVFQKKTTSISYFPYILVHLRQFLLNLGKLSVWHKSEFVMANSADPDQRRSLI